jgi:acetyl-CoA C-acetyltransferase
MSRPEIVLVAARRTPIGSFLGALAPVPATRLGAAAARAVLDDAGADPAAVSEVFMGCVLPAGIGQAPARQAGLLAGLPPSVGSTTLNKVCGSGMKAVMLGTDLIAAGSARMVLAGGMESMSNAPYLLPRAREGLRMGHARVLDHMFFDGLENAADGELMGEFAERCVDRYGFTRAQQDAYAAESVRRAVAAAEQGRFDAEIVSIEVTRRGTSVTVARDEEPGRCDIGKISSLKPSFRRDTGTVTAASSASISDGAAAVLMMAEDTARTLGCPVLARVIGHATHSQAPEEFTTAPIGAVRSLCERIGWSAADVDLYEINEAFAAVALAAITDLGLDPQRVNVNGGACALGHPIGATGARILVTLVHALRARRLERGVAALCIGGGEATAVAIEAV